MRFSLLLALLLVAPAALAQAPADTFFDNLRALCGQAFEGRVVEAPADDTTFGDNRIVMHVRTCDADEIRVPLHVAENRSRTWVIGRMADGLRLKHIHLHEDGSAEELNLYGGDSRDGFTAERVEFFADAETAEMLPPAATNVWTIELMPSEQFVYALRREGTDRRFRIEFDLNTPVTPPPPQWGSSTLD